MKLVKVAGILYVPSRAATPPVLQVRISFAHFWGGGEIRFWNERPNEFGPTNHAECDDAL